MDYCLIVARSVTYAQRMQRALERAGIRSQIFRAPRDLTDLGCAYAVRLPLEDADSALSVLRGAALSPVQIFVNRRGSFREVGYDLS